MELIGINAAFKFGPDVVKEKSSKKLRDVIAFLKKFNLQRSCEYEPLRLISKALDDFKPIRKLEDSMAKGDKEEPNEGHNGSLESRSDVYNVAS